MAAALVPAATSETIDELVARLLAQDEEVILFRIRGMSADTWLELDRDRVRGSYLGVCW